MKTLTAFFFSGTGNTRYIVKYLCKKLSAQYTCELVDITAPGDPVGKIKDSDLLLIAFPIYGSAPPIPMRKFIKKYAPLLKGKKIALAETQYFFSGDGAASLGRAIEKAGGVIVGAEMFNMPNNLADCKMFPIKNGTKIGPTLARAKKRADRFAQRLLKGKAHRRGFSPLSRGVGYFCQRKYWRACEAQKRSRLKVDPERCVGCGICAKSCPVGNLLLQDRRAKPLGSCVLCYRCVNLCPRKAISLIGSEPPLAQYKGPGNL